MHEFTPYVANPGICSICGAVKPFPCYRLRTDEPDEPAVRAPWGFAGEHPVDP